MGVVLNNFCKLDHSFGLETRKQGQNLIWPKMILVNLFVLLIKMAFKFNYSKNSYQILKHQQNFVYIESSINELKEILK